MAKINYQYGQNLLRDWEERKEYLEHKKRILDGVAEVVGWSADMSRCMGMGEVEDEDDLPF